MDGVEIQVGHTQDAEYERLALVYSVILYLISVYATYSTLIHPHASLPWPLCRAFSDCFSLQAISSEKQMVSPPNFISPHDKLQIYRRALCCCRPTSKEIYSHTLAYTRGQNPYPFKSSGNLSVTGVDGPFECDIEYGA